VGFTGLVAEAAGVAAELVGAASGVVPAAACSPGMSVGVSANRITAESSRNDFNITVLLKNRCRETGIFSR
jgi:hypothetical protein